MSNLLKIDIVNTTRNKNRIVIVTLAIVFSVYNVIIYTQDSKMSSKPMPKKALLGAKLWQDNNCTACHQFYGLGGYLGPDLTNIMSHPAKGEDYVKAFLNSAPKSMPKFDFTEVEKDQLVAFLTCVDSTGFYPNKEADIQSNGWVNIKYK